MKDVHVFVLDIKEPNELIKSWLARAYVVIICILFASKGWPVTMWGLLSRAPPRRPSRISAAFSSFIMLTLPWLGTKITSWSLIWRRQRAVGWIDSRTTTSSSCFTQYSAKFSGVSLAGDGSSPRSPFPCVHTSTCHCYRRFVATKVFYSRREGARLGFKGFWSFITHVTLF